MFTAFPERSDCFRTNSLWGSKWRLPSIEYEKSPGKETRWKETNFKDVQERRLKVGGLTRDILPHIDEQGVEKIGGGFSLWTLVMTDQGGRKKKKKKKQFTYPVRLSVHTRSCMMPMRSEYASWDDSSIIIQPRCWPSGIPTCLKRCEATRRERQRPLFLSWPENQ